MFLQDLSISVRHLFDEERGKEMSAGGKYRICPHQLQGGDL